MSDIEKSFTFLHENVTNWFADIANIDAKIVNMQAELARMPVSRSLPLKRKTGSMESIREIGAILEDARPSTAIQSSPLITRKRKIPSVLSDKASGPSKFRSRTMIMVSYDGEIQSLFEQLVRAIGTGRNLLRKGKMAAKLDTMMALASSVDEEDEEDDGALMSNIGYRHRTGLSSMRTRASMKQPDVTNDTFFTPIEVFNSTESALDMAQGLCETAAHQSLREGDCRRELESVRKHLEEVQEVAKLELARCVLRKEKEAKEQAALQLESRVKSPALESTPTTVLKPTISNVNDTTHSATDEMEIEVDEEEEEEDMDFVMPPIRFTSRV
jgi:hypothetical protein